MNYDPKFEGDVGMNNDIVEGVICASDIDKMKEKWRAKWMIS